MRFTMDQVATLLGRSGRGFAMENPNPRPPGELTVQGVSVGVAYVKSVIDSLGLKEFLRLNPWAEQYVEDTARWRKCRCLRCGISFTTKSPKGAVRCPECQQGGVSIEELEEAVPKVKTPKEYEKGGVISPQTKGSLSDAAIDAYHEDLYRPLHSKFKFAKKHRKWY